VTPLTLDLLYFTAAAVGAAMVGVEARARRRHGARWALFWGAGAVLFLVLGLR
jgi:hypothetical protein